MRDLRLPSPWMFFVVGFGFAAQLIPTILALTSSWTENKSFWIGFGAGMNFILLSPWIVIPLLGWVGALSPFLKRLGVTSDRSAFRKCAVAGAAGMAFTGLLLLAAIVVIAVRH